MRGRRSGETRCGAVASGRGQLRAARRLSRTAMGGASARKERRCRCHARGPACVRQRSKKQGAMRRGPPAGKSRTRATRRPPGTRRRRSCPAAHGRGQGGCRQRLRQGRCGIRPAMAAAAPLRAHAPHHVSRLRGSAGGVLRRRRREALRPHGARQRRAHPLAARARAVAACAELTAAARAARLSLAAAAPGRAG